jgi:hypothetical protein
MSKSLTASEWAGPSWRPKNLLRNTETACLLQVAADLHYRAQDVDVRPLRQAGRLSRAQIRTARLYELMRKERHRDQALFLFYLGQVVGLTRLILEADAAHARGLQDQVPLVSSGL